MGNQKSIRCLSVLIVLVILIFLSDNSSADPLDHWHWRNPLPQGNHLSGMAYGNGAFVAIGDSGTILTSPDGAAWTTRSPDTLNQLFGVAYGNGTFVVVGASGTILTSPDGVTWTTRSSGTASQLSRIAYGNGIFVAVGASGTILTSPDGVTWTLRVSGIADHLSGVAYGKGIFVVVGGSSPASIGPSSGYLSVVIITSSDGITWTPRSPGTTNPISAVAYGNGIFVAVANTPPPMGFNPSSSVQHVTSSGFDAIILTSSDGVTWTPQSSSGASFLSDVAYGDGLFVAVGGFNILTSPDGIIWTPQSSGSANSLSGITHGNGIFVVGGYLGVILTSPNGVTWTTRSSGITDNLSGIAYGNGSFVAVGGFSNIGPSGSILTSPDGVTWTTRSSGSSNNLFGVAYGNGTFVAVGYTAVNPSCSTGQCATILTSSDGAAWSVRFSDTSGQSGTPPAGSSFRGVTYGNGIFVAVGYAVGSSGNLTGAIFTSSDGITWTARFFGSPINFLLGVTYGDGTFVVAGEHGILTSPDGITWTSRLSDNSIGLYGVTYGNGIFVAVGGSGNGTTNVMTSPDGITWTSRSSGSDLLSGVAYGNGAFVALVGAYTGTFPPPTMLTSHDGITWTARFLGFYGSGVTYGNGTFVVVGNYGTILQSDDLLVPWCSPGIWANNSKWPIILNIGAPLSLTVGLDVGNLSGINADWWVAAYAPWGWYYYVYPETWIYASTLDNIRPAYQGPLFNFFPIEVLKITDLPVGVYTVYFGVDTSMNGNLDYNSLYFDYISVHIIP